MAYDNTDASSLVGIKITTDAPLDGEGLVFSFADMELQYKNILSDGSDASLGAVDVDSLTIGTLSGILKATDGAVSGNATFLDLYDTPSAYTDKALHLVQVNSAANGLEFTQDITIDTAQFDTTTTHACEEGQIGWNTEDQTLQIGLAGGQVCLQAGQEAMIRASNDTGAQINNGQAVYISGATGANINVKLANASSEYGVRTIALATQDVPAGQKGYFTTFGFVRDLNTAAFTAGDELYLSTTDGGITNVRPTHPNYLMKIGYCIRSHATEGSIYVTVASGAYYKRFQAMVEPTGFDTDQSDLRGDISFSDANRTFTISPKSGQTYFNIWIKGTEYRKTTETIQITDVEGLHYVYYSSTGVISESVNPSSTTVSQMIRQNPIVSIIYWDATNNTAIWFNDERHQIQMDGATHAYLHFTRGTQFLGGGALGDFVVDGDGSSNTHAQFSIAPTTIADEDIVFSSSNLSSTTGVPVIYKNGASGDWRKLTNSGYSVITDVVAGTGATGRLTYNLFSGGSWSLATVANNNFTLCHIIATTGSTSSTRIYAIMGQNEYATKTLARAGANTEKDNLILSGLPGPEFIFIGTIIFEVKDSYTNAVNARIVTNDDGDNYVNWLTTDSGSSTVPTDHGNLSGLEDDDHTQYVLADGTRAMLNLDVDNININGNTISSTDTNGDITITPNGTGKTDITNPKLETGSAADYFETAYLDTGDGDTVPLLKPTSDLAIFEGYNNAMGIDGSLIVAGETYGPLLSSVMGMINKTTGNGAIFFATEDCSNIILSMYGDDTQFGISGVVSASLSFNTDDTTASIKYDSTDEKMTFGLNGQVSAVLSDVGDLTILRNLTINTSTNGILKATDGVVSAATAGTDYQGASANLSSLASLTYTTPMLVKMTGENTFALTNQISALWIVSAHALATFTNNSGSHEFGETENDFTLTWTYNRNSDNPTSQSINNGIGSLTTSLRSYNVTSAGLTTTTTYTITADGDDGNDTTLSTTINFYWKRYYGVSTGDVLTGADVMSVLASQGAEFGTSRADSESFTSGATPTYYYFAYPSAWGAVASWTFNGFNQTLTDLEYSNGTSFGATATALSLTNASGGTANYYIVRSKYTYLNSTDIVTIA